MCRVMGVSPSAYYAWVKRPGQLIGTDTLHLHRRAEKLHEEGFHVGRCKVRSLMKKPNLIATQRLGYKVKTKRKHADKVAPNLLNQNFNPVGKDEVWAGEVTYLRAAEGWMYLSILMDLYSRRIVGGHIDKRMMSAYMRY
jgi:putative transposase